MITFPVSTESPLHAGCLAPLSADVQARERWRTAYGPMPEGVEPLAFEADLIAATQPQDADTNAANADILFIPWDDGHKRKARGRLLTFYRSLPDNADDTQLVFPAFPHAFPELYGPARLTVPAETERPVVSFCGQLRPQARAEFVRDFTAHGDYFGMQVLERPTFGGERKDWRAGYRDSILESDLVLCPWGAGRYSYRLYEALGFNRAPIVEHSAQRFLPPVQPHFQGALNHYICSIDTNSDKPPHKQAEAWHKAHRSHYSGYRFYMLWSSCWSPAGFVRTIYPRILECL